MEVAYESKNRTIVMRSAEYAYWYARFVIKGRWPEDEDTRGIEL